MPSPNQQPGSVKLTNGRILTIDDNAAIHEDYRKVLLRRDVNSEIDQAEGFLFDDAPSPKPSPEPSIEYQIDSAFQGEQGFELVKQSLENNTPYAAAFVDVRMPPGWDGIETVQRIWEIAPDLPVALCTAYADYSWDEIQSKLHRTDQLLILKKPFDPIELKQVAASQVARWHLNKISRQTQEDLEQMVAKRTREIAMTRDLVFFTLARLAESRDPETGEHLDRIEAYTRILAENIASKNLDGYQLTQQNVEIMVRSSVLHDIGKVGIPDSVLLKPGQLTPDEFEVMKTHSEIGATALEDATGRSDCSKFLKTATEIARHHHERYDGSGYPAGLAGNSIPLSARIVAVADVFDALTTERVYKEAMPPVDARELIESKSGSHFDPAIVSVFLDSWDQFHNLAIANQKSSAAERRKLEAQRQFEEAETVIISSPMNQSNAGAETMIAQPN